MGYADHRPLGESRVAKATSTVFSDRSVTLMTAPILQQTVRLVLESEGE